MVERELGAEVKIDLDVVERLRRRPREEERRAWRKFSMKMVSEHDVVRDGWIVVNERVFDITAFARSHPGFQNAGQVSTAIAIARALGKEATEEFAAIHSARAWTQLKDFQIGVLARDGEAVDDSSDVETPSPEWLEGDMTFGARRMEVTDGHLRFLETSHGLPQRRATEVVAEVSMRASDSKGREKIRTSMWRGLLGIVGVALGAKTATRRRRRRENDVA